MLCCVVQRNKEGTEKDTKSDVYMPPQPDYLPRIDVLITISHITRKWKKGKKEKVIS